MLKALRARVLQKYRTMNFPGIEPVLPEKFRGAPIIETNICSDNCTACIHNCPVEVIQKCDHGGINLDLGGCIFCGRCEKVCESKTIRFSRNFRMASRTRSDLMIPKRNSEERRGQLAKHIASMFGRSLKLRQVSAGGCNACEADLNVSARSYTI